MSDTEQTLTNLAIAIGTDVKNLYALTEILNTFEFSSVEDTDLIQYSSSLGKWKNIKKENISDGGNF